MTMNLQPVTVTLDHFAADLLSGVKGKTIAEKIQTLLDVYDAASDLIDDYGRLSLTDEIDLAAHPIAARLTGNLEYLAGAVYDATMTC